MSLTDIQIEKSAAGLSMVPLYDYLLYKWYVESGGALSFDQLQQSRWSQAGGGTITNSDYILFKILQNYGSPVAGISEISSAAISLNVPYYLYCYFLIYQINGGALTFLQVQQQRTIDISDYLLYLIYVQVGGTDTLADIQNDRWDNYKQIILRDYLVYHCGLSYYDPDALLYFAQLVPQPSNAFKDAINTYIVDLKAANIFQSLDRLWLFATEYQQNARVSLVNPGSTQIIEVNSPTWTALRGYTGNGTNMYLRSQFVPSVDGVKYVLNDSSANIYCRTALVNSTGAGYGSFNPGATISVVQLRNADNFATSLNSLTARTAALAAPATPGMFGTRRNGPNNATQQFSYRNGVVMAMGGAGASSSVPTIEFYILARNNNGTPDLFSNRQQSIMSIGNGQFDQTTFYNLTQTLATTLGFNV
jgi:hypothetical protein